MVLSESTENCEFLDGLVYQEHGHVLNQPKMVHCTDQGPGLMASGRNMFELAQHKLDIKHIIDLIALKCKGSTKFVYAVTEATSQETHDNAMDDFARDNPKGADYLKNKIGIHRYSRWYFWNIARATLHGRMAGTQPVEALHSADKRNDIRDEPPLAALHNMLLQLRGVLLEEVQVCVQ
jgi:hypothetical protein